MTDSRSFGEDLKDRATVIAAMVGMGSRDFGIGWANGMARWSRRADASQVPDNSFPQGSIKYAASEAAISFMRARLQQ